MDEICWTNEERRTLKQNYRIRQLKDGYWVTNDGVRMPIKDMATSHIQNCINKVKKDNRIFGDKTNYCVSVLLNELDSRGEKKDETEILINKESLIEHMRKAYEGNTKAGFKWDLISTVAVIGAEEEITPPKAHWIKINNDNDRWKCSCCGFNFIGFNGLHQTFAEMCDYCPCCGAKMDEVEE